MTNSPVCPTCGQPLVREQPQRSIMTFYACAHCKAVWTKAALEMQTTPPIPPAFLRAFRTKDGER